MTAQLIKPCVRRWVALEPKRQPVIVGGPWGYTIKFADGHTLAFWADPPIVTITEFVFDAATFGKAVAKVIKPGVNFTLIELRQDAIQRKWSDVLFAIGPLTNAELGLALKKNRQYCCVKKIGVQNGLRVCPERLCRIA